MKSIPTSRLNGFCINADGPGLTPEEIVKVCKLCRVENLFRFGIGPDLTVNPAAVPAPPPLVVDVDSSQMRFTTGELELALGKAVLKKYLFEAEKERDELMAENAQLRAKNARLGEEVLELKIENP
ncbi:unnamed protein product [Ilex paraguariensis]|uniref:Uncharacterized protein n=1 Tax=Ilex paraguariensis TaxID=185542 RepID=A0ABC8V632_9AQUA